MLSEGPAIESAEKTGGTALSGPAGFTKRAFDLGVALVALILLAPVMLLVTLLVKLDSRGPVLFRSRRIGRGGEPFGMLKFRTMVVDAETQRGDLLHLSEAPDGLFKMQNDPRLTRSGRYLRSTSLDELPQLFQVLTGTMSLVGPRPLPPEEDALVDPDTIRLQARPGPHGPLAACRLMEGAPQRDGEDGRRLPRQLVVVAGPEDDRRDRAPRGPPTRRLGARCWRSRPRLSGSFGRTLASEGVP